MTSIPRSPRDKRNTVTRRLVQLGIGLVLFGVGIGLMLDSGLGVPPWDVLHQGLAVRFGLTVGIWSIIVSAVVLLLWIPLQERIGIGTVANVIIIGLMIDAAAAVIPEPGTTLIAWGMLLGGVLLIGLASGLYIGANFGPGPRDGLMTGIAKRGHSIRLTRTLIEVTVLALGWALGGTFGWGTVIFAVLIGPLVHFFLPRLTISTELVTDPLGYEAR
ncbi:MAG TPA: hypothetical protein VI980_01925 [Acidimicrobiia bacterium]|nr:hypothetical protein [Acidimicrobiia bacterium]